MKRCQNGWECANFEFLLGRCVKDGEFQSYFFHFHFKRVLKNLKNVRRKRNVTKSEKNTIKVNNGSVTSTGDEFNVQTSKTFSHFTKPFYPDLFRRDIYKMQWSRHYIWHLKKIYY